MMLVIEFCTILNKLFLTQAATDYSLHSYVTYIKAFVQHTGRDMNAEIPYWNDALKEPVDIRSRSHYIVTVCMKNMHEQISAVETVIIRTIVIIGRELVELNFVMF